jgi:hypothetical protein
MMNRYEELTEKLFATKDKKPGQLREAVALALQDTDENARKFEREQCLHDIVCTPKFASTDHAAHQRAMDRITARGGTP